MYNKTYQTPYGEVDVPRHLYQASTGGTTFCPLEQEARIILTSTPRFASQVSHKMSEMAAPPAQKDFEINHNRKIVHAMMQRLSEAVASVVQIKEETWSYFAAPKGVANCQPNGIPLENILIKKGLISEQKVGKGTIKSISAKNYLNIGLDELKKKPWLTAKGPELTNISFCKH